jgi:hypothetical protein
MAEQGLDSDPKLIARIIHMALSLGVALTFAILFFVREAGGEVGGETASLFRWLTYIFLAGATVATVLMRSRMPAPRPDSTAEQWWGVNQPRAVVIWAMSEGVALAGIVFGWVAGELELMVLGALFGLGLLFVHRPSRLEGERRL